ncbi:MAG: FAD-dependent oxidoreductase, partial [Bacteroidia bacterium]|nr:FAD-dependent oxidoreductase [Bacteroidia bacterium]
NHLLVESLANQIGNENIKTNHLVQKVNYKNKKIVVYCSNGNAFEADYLICALPTSAINQISWEPEFSPIKKEAFNAIQYCRIIKVLVLFSERFWKSENFEMVTDRLGHYIYHATQNQVGTKGVLCAYAVGDKAHVFHKANQFQKKAIISEMLYPAFGATEKYMEQVVSWYWGNDPYTRGAWALFDTNQWNTYQLDLRTPIEDRIFFAGEHCSDWQGYMEGAVESGIRAAEKLL